MSILSSGSKRTNLAPNIRHAHQGVTTRKSINVLVTQTNLGGEHLGWSQEDNLSGGGSGLSIKNRLEQHSEARNNSGAKNVLYFCKCELVLPSGDHITRLTSDAV